MINENLEYHGSKSNCSLCERHFRDGDLILVDSTGQVLLCADDVVWTETGELEKIPCCVKWTIENKQGCTLVTVVFRKNSNT